jgi:hypothetical protein
VIGGNYKTLSQDGQSLGQDLNLGCPEYEADVCAVSLHNSRNVQNKHSVFIVLF